MSGHGTRARYKRGCRCHPCTEANSTHGARMRENATQRVAEGTATVPHGTLSGYVYWRCRCEKCGPVGRNYHRALRAQKRAKAGVR